MHWMKWGTVLLLWAGTLVAAVAVDRASAPRTATAGPEDLGSAVLAALSEGDELDRAEKTATLLQHLNEENLPGVRAVYDRRLSILGPRDIWPFVAAWARFDPAAAFDHTLAWPLQMKRAMGVEAAMHGWALQNTVEARIAYAQGVEVHRNLREELLNGLVSGWVYSGQDGLDRFLADLPMSSQNEASVRAVGALVRMGGVDAALGWVDSVLSNPEYKSRFKRTSFQRAARAVSREDPARAATWVLGYVSEDFAVDGPRIVADYWGSRDGTATLTWLRGLPAGENRDRGVRKGFTAWLASSPKTAVAWLEAEPASEFRDPAVQVYAKQLDGRDPEQAIVWCEGVARDERKLRCLEIAATAWYRKDALAAEAWLQQSPLGEEARRAARTPPKSKKTRGGASPNPAAPPG